MNDHEKTDKPVINFHPVLEHDVEFVIIRKNYISKIEQVRKVIGAAQGTLDEVRSAGSLNWQNLKHKI